MERVGKLTWANAKTLQVSIAILLCLSPCSTDGKGYWKTRKSFFTDAERADAWEKTAEIVEKYSDEMVKRWNGEIDTLLVYVRVDADRRPSYTDHLRCCPGGFVLRSINGVQRPVVSAAHHAACH